MPLWQWFVLALFLVTGTRSSSGELTSEDDFSADAANQGSQFFNINQGTLDALATILAEAFAQARELLETEENIDSTIAEFLLQQEAVKHIAPVDSSRYVDRHVETVKAILEDSDCLSREFDVQDSDFDVRLAAEVLEKCRILVLRNVLDPNIVLEKFKPQFAKYLHAVKKRKVSSRGRVEYEKFSPTKHYHFMLPKQLAIKELIDEDHILRILHHPFLLDQALHLNKMSAYVNEPGSFAGWQESSNYLMDSVYGMEDYGLAGHDLPLYSINLLTPLLNFTYDHGPTEFCVGTSSTTGLLSGNWQSFHPIEQGGVFKELLDFHQSLMDEDILPCPTRSLRVPLLNVGDAVLFDPQMLHRDGHNNSPVTQASLLLEFAQIWYRGNLEPPIKTPDLEKDRYADLIQSTQFTPSISETVFTGVIAKTPSKMDITVPLLLAKTYVSPPLVDLLEDFRDILHQTQFPFYEYEFVISNLDLDEGSTTVTVDGQDPQPLPVDQSRWSAQGGSKLIFTFRVSSGEIYEKTLILPYWTNQIVVSQAVLKDTAESSSCAIS